LTSQILIEPNLHNKQRIKYSAALRKLCGACCLLPDSHIILDGLEVTSPEPVAYGGFADVFQGSYKGRPVAIKTLRIPAVKEQELARLKKVGKSLGACSTLTLRSHSYSHCSKKLQAGNTWTTPMSSPFSAHGSNSLPFRSFRHGWITAKSTSM
jgi:hypothetical protein